MNSGHCHLFVNTFLYYFHIIFMNFSLMDELKKAKGCMCWQ